jgi:integrase
VVTNRKKLRLAKKIIDALEPRELPYIEPDSEIPGFGIKVMPSGVKTFVLGYRPMPGGRGTPKRQLKLGTYGPMSPEQARQAALTAFAEIRLGHDPQGEKSRQRKSLSVVEFIDAFLENHVSKLTRATGISYSLTLGKFRSVHGGLKAEALTRAQVAAVHRSLHQTPYLANRLLSAVSSLYVWGAANGYVPFGHANPAAKILRFPEAGRERFLTGEELGRLGDALRMAETKYPYPVAAIRVLLMTGARVSEILHARWDWLDIERGFLNLPVSKTGRKSIFLPAPALAILAGLPRLEGNPFIFPGHIPGQPRGKLWKPWTEVRQAAGLDGLRLHDLRHSHASVGAGTGLSLPIIGRLLGHATPAMTARYAHLAADPVRQASEAVGAKIATALDDGCNLISPISLRKRK